MRQEIARYANFGTSHAGSRFWREPVERGLHTTAQRVRNPVHVSSRNPCKRFRTYCQIVLGLESFKLFRSIYKSLDATCRCYRCAVRNCSSRITLKTVSNAFKILFGSNLFTFGTKNIHGWTEEEIIMELARLYRLILFPAWILSDVVTSIINGSRLLYELYKIYNQRI